MVEARSRTSQTQPAIIAAAISNLRDAVVFASSIGTSTVTVEDEARSQVANLLSVLGRLHNNLADVRRGVASQRRGDPRTAGKTRAAGRPRLRTAALLAHTGPIVATDRFANPAMTLTGGLRDCTRAATAAATAKCAARCSIENAASDGSARSCGPEASRLDGVSARLGRGDVQTVKSRRNADLRPSGRPNATRAPTLGRSLI